MLLCLRCLVDLRVVRFLFCWRHLISSGNSSSQLGPVRPPAATLPPSHPATLPPATLPPTSPVWRCTSTSGQRIEAPDGGAAQESLLLNLRDGDYRCGEELVGVDSETDAGLHARTTLHGGDALGSYPAWLLSLHRRSLSSCMFCIQEAENNFVMKRLANNPGDDGRVRLFLIQDWCWFDAQTCFSIFVCLFLSRTGVGSKPKIFFYFHVVVNFCPVVVLVQRTKISSVLFLCIYLFPVNATCCQRRLFTAESNKRQYLQPYSNYVDLFSKHSALIFIMAVSYKQVLLRLSKLQHQTKCVRLWDSPLKFVNSSRSKLYDSCF